MSDDLSLAIAAVAVLVPLLFPVLDGSGVLEFHYAILFVVVVVPYSIAIVVETAFGSVRW